MAAARTQTRALVGDGLDEFALGNRVRFGTPILCYDVERSEPLSGKRVPHKLDGSNMQESLELVVVGRRSFRSTELLSSKTILFSYALWRSERTESCTTADDNWSRHYANTKVLSTSQGETVQWCNPLLPESERTSQRTCACNR